MGTIPERSPRLTDARTVPLLEREDQIGHVERLLFEASRREVARYLEVVGNLDPTIEGPPPLEKFTIAGTPEEVAAHALRLYDAGVQRVEFGTPQGLTTGRGVELLCDRVLPLL